MQLEYLPIDTIEIPSVRITNVMSPEIEELFRRSLQRHGALEPILCVREGDHIYLVDGLHRLLEARERGDATIPAIILEGTLRDVLTRNLVTSVARGKPRHAEVRQVVQALQAEYGLDLRALHQETGASEQYLSDLMWVNGATSEVQEALDSGAISLSHAVLLARLGSPIAQGILLSGTLAQRWTVVDLRTAIVMSEQSAEQAVAQAAQPQERPRPLANCEVCQATIAASRARLLAVCPACYGRIWQVLLAPAESVEAAGGL